MQQIKSAGGEGEEREHEVAFPEQIFERGRSRESGIGIEHAALKALEHAGECLRYFAIAD